MAFKYHVTLSEHQKCSIAVNEKGILKSTIMGKFNLDCRESSLVIQYWNSEWDELENVNDFEDLPDRAKLRLFIRDEESSSTCSKDKYLSESGTLADTSMSENDPLDESLTDSSQDHTKQLVNQNPWPSKFILPKKNFGQSLTRALQEQKAITGILLSKLTETIYEEVIKYTFYPTPLQYRELAEELIKEYPYLSHDVPGSDAVSTWKHAIAHRFRNNRKRKDRDMMMPRKRICTTGENIQQIEGKPTNNCTKNQWVFQIFSLKDPKKKMTPAYCGI